MEVMVYSLLWVMQDLYHQPVDGINPALPIPRMPWDSGPGTVQSTVEGLGIYWLALWTLTFWV